VLLDGLRLDHDVGPYGFQQLIVRDQTAGVFNQISENRKGLRRHQDALLASSAREPPETLIYGVESERMKDLHSAILGQTRRETASELNRNFERTTERVSELRLWSVERFSYLRHNQLARKMTC
jgi:hypothetical protein